MALMNLNIDGVLTVEKVIVPADGILTLGHDLFRGERIIIAHNGVRATRGQDFIPDRIDERLYYQKNICLFTAIKILDESLLNEEIEVEYYACGDYINAEIWNEYPSSASLKQSLASKVDNSDFIKEVKRIDNDIYGESTARADADNALQDKINTETNLRIGEDEKLQVNIDNEATARTDADNTLQANIDTEAVARESADNEIRNELSSETNLRLAGDAVLQEKIDAEMSTREENDSSLQTQISDLKTKFESFVPGLTYKVVSALPTADILNDVIYLVPADSTGSQSVYDEYIYIDGNWELIGTTATTQAISVDSELSETSTNPVQNKVINEALNGKLDATATAIAAKKLTANEGSNGVPVYFEQGTPKECGANYLQDSRMQKLLNSKTWKIILRKKSKAAAGFMSYSYSDVGADCCVNRINIRISSATATYDIAEGRDFIQNITCTFEDEKVTIGIKLKYIAYGTSIIYIPSEFAELLSFTSEDFTGEYTLTKQSPIDAALSSTSENPVQNKVVAAEISALKSKASSQEITGYTVKNSSYYKNPGVVMNMWKKNGIAFVNLQVQCVSPSASGRVFISGLPPSAISLYFEVQLNNDITKLHVSIDTSGNLSLSDGTQNNIYRVAFSYPIDD